MKLFTRDANWASGFAACVVSRPGGARKEKRAEERPEETKQEPLNAGAARGEESFDRTRYENARNELRRRKEQKMAEEKFEECIPIRDRLKVGFCSGLGSGF